MFNIVLATNNQGKIREFEQVFNEQAEINITPQSAFEVNDVSETGLTFVENALIKARHATSISKLPALADDSGLVVPILDGAPGILSARFAGEKATSTDNINKLLFELKDVPEKNRQAYFYCVLVLLLSPNDPAPLICEGKWPGILLSSPQGDQGFGYDPIFYIPSLKKTAAQLSIHLKNKISHRGIALQSLLKLLPEKI